MQINEFLSSTFLFSGLASSEIEALIKENPPSIKSYKRGDLVYSCADGRLVGFIVSGECEIRRVRSDGSKTVLNSLHQNASFGILSVFSSEEFPTQVFATRNSEILYFTQTQINFLAGRISFLNKKIETFSGTRVEDRLSAFILIEADKFGSLSFPFNVQKTAEEINAGRASVYRALASLEENGLIFMSEKIIYIKDLKGLERIVK